MGIRRNNQLRGVYALVVQAVNLAEENLEVNHDAIANNWHNFWGQDAGGQKVKCELFITNDYGVASVIATLVANYVIDSVAKKVCGLAFAFIAPLGTN